VEWAVNNHAGRDFAESYEGVLRQLLRAPGSIAVIELFFMHKDGENAQMWQEILGRHYQLPMVSFRDALWPELTGGRIQWDDLYADVVHPKDAGHLLTARLLVNLLETALHGQKGASASAEVPPPLISNLYEKCTFSYHENLTAAAVSGWKRSADQKFWEGVAPGDWIEFEFTGRSLFMGYDFDKEHAPQAFYSVDDGSQQSLKEDAHRRPVATNLNAGSHRIRIELKPDAASPGKPGKLKIWGVGGAQGGDPPR